MLKASSKQALKPLAEAVHRAGYQASGAFLHQRAELHFWGWGRGSLTRPRHATLKCIVALQVHEGMQACAGREIGTSD